MSNPAQFEEEFDLKELEIIDRDIKELVFVYRDALKTDHVDIPKLLQLQLVQLRMLRTLKNMETLLLKD